MRPLTPEQHARLRWHLVLIPAYVWLVFGWTDLVVHLPVGLPGAQGQVARDFIQFYIQGTLANQRDAHGLYDIDAWPAMVSRLVPGAPDTRYPPVYGPQIALLFSPLARLPYVTAMLVWMAWSLVAYLACGYVFWKACPRLRHRRWTTAVLLLAAPALHFALSFAQISAIALLCVTGAFFALRANHRLAAGLAIGSLIYKPQLGLAAAFIFLGAREWRLVLGAMLGAALQLAAAGAFWGPSILGDYARSLVRLVPAISTEFEPFRFHMHSWSAFFDLLGLPGDVAVGAYAVAAIITLTLALRCWRSRGPLALRYSVFLIATVLVSPHMYVYDLVLLTPAFLLLWDWVLAERDRPVADLFPRLGLTTGNTGLAGNDIFPRARWPPWLARQFTQRSFSGPFQWLLYFCYFSPLFASLAGVARVQVSVLALSLLGLVLTGILRLPRQLPAAWVPAPVAVR